MKRQSRAGGAKRTKVSRQAVKPSRRTPPHEAIRPTSSASEEGDVARLTLELHQALEQQAATSEVLGVISSSPGELERVFQSILEKATRICEATFGNIYRWQDGALHLVAAHNTPPAFEEARRRLPLDPHKHPPIDHMVATKATIHVIDAASTPDYIERKSPNLVEVVELGGVRTALAVPMVRDNELIGSLTVYRQEVRPFSDKQIELVTNFAAQAVIAIENARLLNELRRRTTDLTERTTDLMEALEQQTATSEVLQVISSSSGDLEPVFATMLENAARICEAKFGNIYRWDGEALRLVATHNTPPAYAEERRRSPYRPYPHSHIGRLVADKTVAHVSDLMAEEVYIAQLDPVVVSAVTLGGFRTLLGVPLLSKGELTGAFFLSRQEVRPFTNKQIALVQSFAAQAVIAIENARLLNELRQRTDDLTEALEQQTGTSELLQAISSSSGDLEPVFAAMLENAVRICGATFGNIYRVEGDGLRIVATHNTPPVFAGARRTTPYFSPGPKNPVRHMMTTKSVVHVDDVAATEAYADREPAAVASVELGGTRTLMIVPMLKENELVGACMLARQEIRPFNNKQIELVTNFAAQAVIAIENARLLNELRQRTTDLTERTADLTEALDQQTATSEVLQVISSSPGDLQPVFEAMLEKAVRICDAKFGNIFRWDNEGAHVVATHNTPPAFAEARRRSPNPANPKTSFGRMIATKAVVHVADAAAEPGYIEQHDQAAVEAVELRGVRTALYVPMLKENELVGAFTLSRQEVRPFNDKQMELVQNFAAQAVIAIENARLLNELRQRTNDLTEALEQQTATSEVLQVISSSPGALEPVFAAMLDSATRICEAKFGNLFLREEESFRLVAWHGELTYVENWRREPLIIKTDVPDIPLARLAETKQRVHVADLKQEPHYKAGFAPLVALVDGGALEPFSSCQC